MPKPVSKNTSCALAALALAAMAIPTARAVEPATIVASGIQEALHLPELVDSTNTVVLADGTNSVAFHPGYRRFELNGMAVWLNSPALAAGKDCFTIARSDLEGLLAPLVSTDRRPEAAPAGAAAAPGTNAMPRVFIDAGHGGDDPGASSPGGLLEKDVALDIALRLGELLEDAGFDVAYARTNDIFVALGERSELAKKSGAGLFASIHCNTTVSKAARGFETFSLSLEGCDSTAGDSRVSKRRYPGNDHDARNSLLGYCIHAAVNTERGEADRGLRHARFQVLRNAPCPAVLIECGFLSNAAESASLASPRYRQRVACAIARGIADFAIRDGVLRAMDAGESESGGEAPADGDAATEDPVELVRRIRAVLGGGSGSDAAVAEALELAGRLEGILLEAEDGRQ